MFKLNLKIAFRNLWKNKVYTLINLIGLAVGMAGCILIYIFISYQLSFDQHFSRKDRIYRVVSYWKYPDGEQFQSGVPKPLANAIRNDFSQLDEVSVLQRGGGIVQRYDEAGKLKLKSLETVFYTDPAFFRMFDFKWLRGRPEQAVTMPNTMALSRKMALKFFGNWEAAIGKTLVFGDHKPYQITAVFEDQPETSSNPLEIVLAHTGFKHRQLAEWGAVSSGTECYVLLKQGLEIGDLKAGMQAFIQKYYVRNKEITEDHLFQPLHEVHTDVNYQNFAYKTSSMRDIYGLGIIGFLLLLTACINFVNLSTALAVGRSREVGIRKVIGSTRSELLLQFFTETIALCVLALLLACIITEAVLPALAGLFNAQLTFNFWRSPALLLFMLALVLFVGVMAGFYPALILSRFNPALALKNKLSMGSTGGIALRKILVVLQFSITVILITGTLIIVQQMKYMREKPLGFNPTAIAMPSLPTDSTAVLKFEIFKQRIAALPGVLAVSLCNAAPSSGDNTTSTFAFNSTTDEDFLINTKAADADYLQTFGLKLAAGRFLSKTDTLKEVVINETLMTRLNIRKAEDAIGQYIFWSDQKLPIVGVVKDFINKSLKEDISPIVLYSNQKSFTTLAVKMESHKIPVIMPELEAIWNSYYPANIFVSSFLDEQIQAYYESEQVMGTMLKIFASLIIMIAFIGLFGLISFVAIQRTKEMAIRKVLGASTKELVTMLNSSFVKLILIANLLAWPLTYYLVSRWLSGYVYRIDITLWPFLLALLVSLLITIVTVSLRTYQAASANPVDALKNE